MKECEVCFNHFSRGYGKVTGEQLGRYKFAYVQKKRVEASLRIQLGVCLVVTGHKESGEVTQFKEACFGSRVSCYLSQLSYALELLIYIES